MTQAKFLRLQKGRGKPVNTSPPTLPILRSQTSLLWLLNTGYTNLLRQPILTFQDRLS